MPLGVTNRSILKFSQVRVAAMSGDIQDAEYAGCLSKKKNNHGRWGHPSLRARRCRPAPCPFVD